MLRTSLRSGGQAQATALLPLRRERHQEAGGGSHSHVRVENQRSKKLHRKTGGTKMRAGDSKQAQQFRPRAWEESRPFAISSLFVGVLFCFVLQT